MLKFLSPQSLVQLHSTRMEHLRGEKPHEGSWILLNGEHALEPESKVYPSYYGNGHLHISVSSGIIVMTDKVLTDRVLSCGTYLYPYVPEYDDSKDWTKCGYLESKRLTAGVPSAIIIEHIGICVHMGIQHENVYKVITT